MKIRWEVDDGYVGKSRPHYALIDDGELAKCQTKEERRRLIDENVEDDFNRRVSFTITDDEY